MGVREGDRAGSSVTWNSCGVYMSFLAHGHSLECFPVHTVASQKCRERFRFYGKTGCLVLRYTRLLYACSPCNNRHVLPSSKLHAPISLVIYKHSESTIMSMSIHLNHRLSPHLCAHCVCTHEYQSSVRESQSWLGGGEAQHGSPDSAGMGQAPGWVRSHLKWQSTGSWKTSELRRGWGHRK